MVVVTRQKCHKNARCRLRRGKYKCLCKRKYIGDGVDVCKRKATECKRKCHKKAKCKNGKCICKKGYTGDGIKSCSKKPKCKRKCHKNARCEKRKCICKRGYTGDGVNSCSKSCTCSATGDPHYRTFDGQIIHFMGTCKYTLSQYINPKSSCRFDVQVKNENRGNKKVSYTRSVHVNVRGTKVNLLKGKKVKVNGIKRYLPYKNAYFSIINSGRYIRLKTSCKVIVTWDGKSAATVSVPSHFSENLIGLCGNCNGIKDDFRTKDGTDVRSKQNKFTLIGESYLIPEGNAGKCGVSSPPDPCSAELRRKAEGLNACGRIKLNNRNPFKTCAEEDPEMVQDMYDTCIYDYCAYSDRPDVLETVVCEIAEGLEERCENMGLDITWRTKQFCPLVCGENMVYSSAVSGCPATCVDLDAPKNCDLPPSEGCMCQKGFVLSDDKCIPKAQCGCRGPSGEYYPIGTEITSKDCTSVSKCITVKSGRARLKKIKSQKCHRHGECKINNGLYECLCEDGYKGDGIKRCKGPDEPGIVEVICEGHNSEIKCNGKKTIKILEVMYGRTDRTTCKDPRIRTTSCSSDVPLPIVRKNCDGRKSCKIVSTNGLYGDPCPGTYKYLKVRYSCEASTQKCGSSVCHSKATCQDGRCVCPKGYTGDGVNSCVGTCTCSATGDPHYRTFDNQIIHFMGICTYTMVKSSIPDKCGGFEVQVKNEHRGNNKKVSYTQYVTVILKDIVVRLDKNKKLFVNDVEVYSPYSCGDIEIIASGKYVRLQTKCDLVVTWDGRSAVSVSIPKTYSGKVTGLCGDCNGKKDDLRTASGEDVSQKNDKFVLIGRSYIVPGILDSTNDECFVTPIDNPCNADILVKGSNNKYCGLINPKNNNSPFKSCFVKDADMTQDMYSTCLYDYCSNVDKTDVGDIICEALEGYEEQCENLGLSVTWRNKDFCPLSCPPNMEYSSSVSGCPATCVNPNAPASCRLPNSEGCQCKKGFLLSGTKCVRKAECGCCGPEGEYYPIGKEVTSEDCTIVTKCVVQNNQPTMNVIKQQKCHKNARCRLRMGRYKCICKRNYNGNGVDVCNSRCNPKCKQTEVCRQGKCQCRKGFYRTKDGLCKKKKLRCKPKCGENFRCVKGKCKPRVTCNPKCEKSEVCRQGKCRCRKGFYRTKDGLCKKKRLRCKPTCGENFKCVKGKCKPKVTCNPNCKKTEVCRQGQCQCRKGFYRTKDALCKRKRLRCKPKCGKNFKCVKGKCRPKVTCNPKCKKTEVCRQGQCQCRKGFYRSKDGLCKRKKLRCKQKCGENFTCVKGKCRPKANCDPKCKKSEVCRQGKCKCRLGFYRSKTSGLCKRRRKCNPKCKRNALCIKGRCKCRSGYFGIGGGRCRKRCDDTSCGVNALCYKRRYCRCKKGFGGNPYTLCKVIQECLMDSQGLDYVGTISRTESGRVCQHWIRQTPHRHKFEKVGDALNYCRNPDHTSRPWCYTRDRNKRWEYCNIPPCEAVKPPCTTTIDMKCSSEGKKRSVCLVPGALKINYLELKDNKANKKCIFGITYGYYGHKIWSKKSCRATFSICYTPRIPNPILPPAEECRNTENGEDYKGTWSRTDSGKNCQRWDLQFPHKHPFFLVGLESENYCRNFDGSERPWCYTEDPNTDREYCPIHMCAPEDPGDVEECISTEQGKEYKGQTNVTKSGLTCQYWERQYPQKHSFGKLKTEHNFCRNPDNSPKPWCYTNDPHTRWEICEIPMCAACTLQEDIVKCKATIKLSGKCFYKSKQGSTCSYSVQLTGAEANIKTNIQEIKLTNGGTLSDCAEFIFSEGILQIEEDICKCETTMLS